VQVTTVIVPEQPFRCPCPTPVVAV